MLCWMDLGVNKVTVNPNTKKSLIIGYFLSRFDEDAYNFFFSSDMNVMKTHRYIGKKLNYSHYTIKNIRDTFDPYMNNNRVGWLTRELTIPYLDVMSKYDCKDFKSISRTVKRLLK